ncbi:MAG: sugar transferase [Mycobacterium sp.]|nr:sugar transferase [Mycobacterium sp.]
MTDLLVVLAALLLAQYVRFDVTPLGIFAHGAMGPLPFVLGLMWLAALSIFQTRSPRVLGAGLDEYRRVGSATFWVFGFVAIVALLLKVEPSRGYLAVALPAGTFGLLISRWAWRRHMVLRRARGDCQNPLVVIGDRDAVVTLVSDLTRNSDHFYDVVGVGIYDHEHGDTLDVAGTRVSILGDERQALAALKKCGANTVALTGMERFGSRGIRNLLWDLESQDIDLIVSPTSTRLMMHPIPGYALLHVERPHYQEAKRFHKRTFDICFAAAALTAAAPVLLVAAVAVKLTSRGPVFYAAERVGLDGEPFTMLKLRTMVSNAEALLDDLAHQNESHGGVLFKMREDPRITPVGKILRRFSIDEIPQFINVIRGDMSVVGPRPPLQREVATYDGEVRRRLLVRPGVTGLWQVSGRSDLTWDQSVRLDLSYVENWSMGTDLVLILKTVRAVLGRNGAY